MPGSHTDFPPGERSPLVSIAGLPAAVPVARSAAPASPTSVQTASAAAWRAAASDARSRFRATAVAHVAPAPRLSTLPPEEDSDPEASWLPCAEYRMNLRAAIRSAQKKLCKRTSRVTPTVRRPPHLAGRRPGLVFGRIGFQQRRKWSVLSFVVRRQVEVCAQIHSISALVFEYSFLR